MKRWLCACIVCMGCWLSIGCDSDFSNRYGASTYPERNTSINGMGVFFQLCKDAGMRTIEVRQLSPRLDNVDVLLLVGDTLVPPATEARDWIETWLSQKPGRTVIYFGRDFDSDIFYRQATLAQVPPDQQQRARLELANAQAALDARISGELAHDTFCRWFVIRPQQPSREIKQFVGPWAAELAASDTAWPIRVQLEPPSADWDTAQPQWALLKSQTVQANAANGSAETPRSVNKEATPLESAEPSPSPQKIRSIWSASDISDEEAWQREWEKVPKAEVLLAGKDGPQLVTCLRSKQYPDSQIITLVNGAPLLNGPLVEPFFRQVAHQLINQLLPAKRIAVLHFDLSGILISDNVAEGQVEGLAILTTWPLNIIFAHLVFAGCLVLLAVFPIFGRPQDSEQHSVSDFGQHAEAVGQMLAKTGDTQFALKSISDYYTQVCNEQPPAWVQSALRAPGQIGSSVTRPTSEPSEPPNVSSTPV